MAPRHHLRRSTAGEWPPRVAGRQTLDATSRAESLTCTERSDPKWPNAPFTPGERSPTVKEREGTLAALLELAATLSGMCPPQIFRAALLVLAILVVACTDPSPTKTHPGATFALPTAPPENAPTEPPPGMIPSGFDLPVPVPLMEGNADLHAQRALFHRTGSLCFTQVDDEGGVAHLEGLASTLGGPEGLLEDGRSYVGPLEDALAALDLEPTGIRVGNVAYGIGRVQPDSDLVHLPAGTVWAPRLTRFELPDGRSGWSLTGGWIAVVDRACGVLPTTPG